MSAKGEERARGAAFVGLGGNLRQRYAAAISLEAKKGYCSQYHRNHAEMRKAPLTALADIPALTAQIACEWKIALQACSSHILPGYAVTFGT